MRAFTLFLLFFIQFNLSSQTVPDFTVTDTDGKVHKLYADYLDNNKIVVLKIFFVNCPPCNQMAPLLQQKYIDWGSGTGNVSFIEMTNKIGDNDNIVKTYINKHGITFPSISSQGNALTAVQPYIDGTLGQWSGTPFLAILTPDKKVKYDVLFNNLDAMLASVGGVKPNIGSTVNFSFSNFGNQLPQGVSLIMKSSTNASTPSYNITQLTNGTNSFTYPSSKFPKIDNPVITLDSKAPAYSSALITSDLVVLRNHILGTSKLTNPGDLLAGDLNGDGKIISNDLLILQRVIAGLVLNLPNNTPSYKMLPAEIPLNVPASGGNVNLSATLVKIGNVKP